MKCRDCDIKMKVQNSDSDRYATAREYVCPKCKRKEYTMENPTTKEDYLKFCRLIRKKEYWKHVERRI